MVLQLLLLSIDGVQDWRLRIGIKKLVTHGRETNRLVWVE